MLHLSKDPCNIIYAETINVLHVLYRCKKEYFAREYSAEESFPIDPSADKKNQRKQKQISFQPEQTFDIQRKFLYISNNKF